MTATATTTAKPPPRTSTLDRTTADRLAATEYQRFADLLAGLGADQWRAPTVCPGWDVRAVAAHCLGMAEMIATTPEMVRQNLRATIRSKRRGSAFIDELTALQVEEHADLDGAAIAAAYAAVGPRAARSRARATSLTRRMTMVNEPGDVWTMGYLWETILTRDPWLHRVDITDACGATMVLTPEHDGVLVDDVVGEWAARHGRPFHLELTGAAGGRWSRGAGGPELCFDALDFCRRLSGRAPAEGLLETQVPF
ncbi:maleylpyruvate isomerase family mycothiol-dependent enzyme [Actinomycetospora sp. CA-101289]|uniref:maleylpyruvate isomerase family mycothiol-dependent enzyme n=1 Tax=Actinomycetospora sp. CA-101289 TaxID=3239893 RepID=UPI003D97AB65